MARVLFEIFNDYHSKGLMDSNVIAALLTAGVTGLISMISLFIGHALEQKKEDKAWRREMKIAYLEKQIEELNGSVRNLFDPENCPFTVLPIYKKSAFYHM